MALFNQTLPLSQTVDTPDLLPYDTTLTKRNGKPTGVKKALDWLLPAAGAVVGTVIAPGIGTKIGASLGTAATSAMNRSERNKAASVGATDALQNIDNSMGASVSAGNLVNMASGLLNFTPAGSPSTSLQSIDQAADPRGIGQNALDASGMTDYRTSLNSLTQNIANAKSGMSSGMSVSFNPSGVNPSDLLSAGLVIPTLSQSPAQPRKIRYNQVFADGGIPEPVRAIGFNSPTMTGRTSRRQQRLLDGAAERVSSEMDRLGANQQYGIWNELYGRSTGDQNLDRMNQSAGSLENQSTLPFNTAAAQAGADYVRQYLSGRGYNAQANTIGTPAVLSDQDFNQLLSSAWDGIYRPGDANAYVREGNPSAVQSNATHEAVHQAQSLLSDNPQMRQSLTTIGSMVKPGSDPYLGTPEEIQSRLFQQKAAVNQNPNEDFNRWGWRWARFKNMFTHDIDPAVEAFKANKQVLGRQGVFNAINSFNGGGIATAERYNHYNPGDKTEDIVMTDKATGEQIGEMRYMERIFDQDATKTMDEAVHQLREKPDSKGFEWLGKFVFNEIGTHKDHQKFADGGTPKKPDSTVRQIQQEMKNAGLYSGPVDGIMSVSTESSIQRWNKQTGLDPAKKVVVSADDSGNAIGADFRGQDAPGATSISDVTYSNDGVDAGFTVQKPAKTPGVSVPAPTTRQPGLIGSVPAWLNIATKIKPVDSKPDTSPITPLAPLSDVTTTTTTSKSDQPKPDQYNWLNANNIMNAGRVVTGLLAANTPYPNEIDTSKLDRLVSEAESRREEGLSAISRKLANDALSDNRTTAYEALRRNFGGGGSSGSVLAGLGQIGQNEVSGDLALANADQAQRERNRYDYQRLLGAQMDIANQRFNRQFQAAQATRQAGLNLIPQGLQGITDDYQYWQNYQNPNSPYQRLLNSQVSLADQNAKAASRIYGSNARTFLNAGLDTSLSPIPPASTGVQFLSPVTPTPTSTDYRQFGALPVQNTTPLVPYRYNG